LIALKDFEIVEDSSSDRPAFGTVRKGEVFWVLNAVDEGMFNIWWHCSIVGWDSTEPSDVAPNRLEHLGENEERWVKIRDNKTGLSGWFKDVSTENGPKLEPSHATTKAIG
jgi:hypothetical protein